MIFHFDMAGIDGPALSRLVNYSLGWLRYGGEFE